MMARKKKEQNFIAKAINKATKVSGSRTVREGNWDVTYITLKPRKK
tara:strand:+ start:1063 stop:1200 length:138 start_codon:yes stop_codon:yes gene_type:complete